MKILLFRSAPDAVVATALREIAMLYPGIPVHLLETRRQASRPGEFHAAARMQIVAERFSVATLGGCVTPGEFDLAVIPENDPRGGGYTDVEAAARHAAAGVVFACRPGAGLVQLPAASSSFPEVLGGIVIALAARIARLLGGRRLERPELFVEEAGHRLSDIYFLERSSIHQGMKILLPPGTGRLIDIGCGSMPHRGLAEEKGYAYLGIDLEERGMPDHLLFGNAGALPLRSGSIEAAWSVETIEHLRDPSLFVREAARVLKPGGLFLLVAPQVWGLHEEPHDYWRFTCHGLAALLEDAGFTVERTLARGGYVASAIQRLISHLNRRGLARTPGAGILDWVTALNRLAVTRDRDPNETLGWIVLARKRSDA